MPLINIPSTIHVYHHFDFEALITKKLDQIIKTLESVQKKEVILLATLQEALDKVTESTTVVEGLSGLTYQIKAMLDAELANDLTPEQQAKVDAIFVTLQANNDKAAKAILDNTPQAPPVPE